MFKSDPLSPLPDASEVILCPRRTGEIRTVCVFGGAKGGRDPRLTTAATALGVAIAEADIHLVYGGGCQGLMGTVAGAAASAGGRVTAIAPRFLAEEMRAIRGDCQAIIVPDMSIRKQLMFDYADAFVALPGGIGTIEELAEVLTDRKLGRHRKPVLLANFHGFWLPWFDMLDHLSVEGFLSADTIAGHLVVGEPAEVIPALRRAGASDAEFEDAGAAPLRSSSLPLDETFARSLAGAGMVLQEFLD